MTEDELLEAVLARPDEDAPRLVLADYLTDQGDARGELIALQCALARSVLPEEKRRELLARERALLQAHADRWLLAVGLQPGEGHFVRGLLESVELPWARLQALEGPLSRCPLRALFVGEPPTELDALLSLPLMKRLTSLRLQGNPLGNDGAQVLASSPFSSCLTEIDLGQNGIRDEGAAALATSLHSPRLTSLRLEYNAIGDEGTAALATSPSLRGLTLLDLRGNNVGDKGATALAASPSLRSLMVLNLRNNAIEDEGAAALARLSCLRSSILLDLRDNDIGEELEAELRDRFGESVFL